MTDPDPNAFADYAFIVRHSGAKEHHTRLVSRGSCCTNLTSFC
jgi:hypothetical protein